jgi:carboxymethylenebutenolidase
MNAVALSVVIVGASVHLLLAQNSPESVTFKSGPLTLHGSLWKPSGAGPFPAVLYNHGSEKPVDYLAALGPVFTSRGYLLFVPERRGHGRSADQSRWISDLLAEERKTNGMEASAKMMIRLLETEHLEDQLAALTYLKSHSDVDVNRIAIAGCSFGGIQTLLAGEQNTGAKAGVNFAGAALTWTRSPLIPERLRAAVRRAEMPIFFVQAENDYNTAPSRELAAEMEKAGKPYQIKIFPPFGTTPEEGHTPFCANGADVWGPDVFQFLARYLKAH